MRVGIIGAGALGSVIGGLLTEAGVDTILFERDAEETDSVQKNGLAMEGVSGDRLIRANITSAQDCGEKRDFVIVLVKSYDTSGTIPLVGRILSEDGVVLTLQNGIGNFEILEAAFPKRVLLGTTTIGAMTLGKGKVRHTGFGQTHLGEPDGAVTARAEAVVSALSRMNAGPVHVTDNAMGSVWSKLMINACINAPATLLRVRNGDLPATESGRELIHRIVVEGLTVARAKGIKLLFEDTEGQVITVCQGTAPNINSMFQDVLAQRRTEIDFINGALSREGERLGVPTPINEALTLLVRSLESTASVRV